MHVHKSHVLNLNYTITHKQTYISVKCYILDIYIFKNELEIPGDVGGGVDGSGFLIQLEFGEVVIILFSSVKDCGEDEVRGKGGEFRGELLGEILGEVLNPL